VLGVNNCSAMSPSLPSVRMVRAAIAAGPPNARRVPAIATRERLALRTVGPPAVIRKPTGSSVVMYGGYSSLSFPRRALSDTWRLQVGRGRGLHYICCALLADRCTATATGGVGGNGLLAARMPYVWAVPCCERAEPAVPCHAIRRYY
jgi:hypothetical protein